MNKTRAFAVALAALSLSPAYAATDSGGKGGAEETACEKGCIPAHDGSQLNCKLFKKPEQVKTCMKAAEDKRKACEKDCRAKEQKRAAEKQQKKATEPKK
jgi:hypothetical protein